jgi:hypothetical protein
MNRRAFLLVAVTILSGCALFEGRNRISRSFPLDGIQRVVLRTSAADDALVQHIGKVATVSGVPFGGAKGYHPSDPNWKETPATEWGLDFVAERFGNTLVISSKNVIQYIHHHYAIHDIVVQVPLRVELVREKRALTGNGAPNLERP